MKTSVSRLVNILFPELEKLVPTLHIASVYTLLMELPGAKQVASCHLTHLTSLLFSHWISCHIFVSSNILYQSYHVFLANVTHWNDMMDMNYVVTSWSLFLI